MGDRREVFVVSGGQSVRVEVERAEGISKVRFAGREFEVDERAYGEVSSLCVAGQQHEVAVCKIAGAPCEAVRYLVTAGGQRREVDVFHPLAFLAREAEGAGGRKGKARVLAQMPGRVVSILLGEGDMVAVGQGVVVVEAMKMENEIRSELGGELAKVFVESGATVETGDPLFEVRATPE